MTRHHVRGPLDPSRLCFDPPNVPLDRVAGVLADRYGLSGTLRSLEGERDQNTKVTASDGREFVLKIASPSEDPTVADLQCAALRHVVDADPGIGVPRVVPALDGSLVVETDVDGAPAPTRLVTFLEGVTFHAATSLPSADLVGVGETQGRLARALGGFDHPAASNFMAWSLDSGMIHHPDLWDELSAEGRDVAAPLRDRVETAAAQLVPGRGLRHQVVHNDGHRGNLLRPDPTSSRVTGVIDFGDIAETYVAADLAICIASFTEGHDDPIGAAAAIADGYDRWMPLADAEIRLLADLTLVRIVLGLLLVEFQARHAPAHRRDEIVGELPSYRTNMSVWGSLDAGAATDAVLARLDERRAWDR